MNDKIIIDTDTGELASDTDMQQAVNVRDLQTAVPEYVPTLSETDIKAGKAICKDMVDKIVALHLPAHLAKQERIMQVVQMQQRFEEFTLASMFAVVAQAVQVLEQLTMSDDIYTPEGILDPCKLQSILNTQQHVMNVVQQFNLHLRRLPQALVDMLHSIEYSQTIQAELVQPKQIESGRITSKPFSAILAQAKSELEQQETNAAEQSEQTIDEHVDEQDINEGDDDDISIEL